MHYIYKITITTNNKTYVGQSKDPKQRWRQHNLESRKNFPSMIINRAMKKHGTVNCIFEVIASCLDQDAANITEAICIEQENSHISNNQGYNVSLGGSNAPKTEEWKQKMKELWLDPDWRENQISIIKESQNNRTSEEKVATAKLLSKIFSGRHLSPETEFKKGHTFTPETLEKMSRSKIGIEPWNKGTEGIMKSNHTSFAEGHETWNKGLKGVNKNGSKLSKNDILYIVDSYANKEESYSSLALIFNLKESSIRSIINGRTFSNITGIPKPDRIRAKRKSSYAKISDSQILEILELLKIKSVKEIAVTYQVAKQTVYEIKNGVRKIKS